MEGRSEEGEALVEVHDQFSRFWSSGKVSFFSGFFESYFVAMIVYLAI